MSRLIVRCSIVAIYFLVFSGCTRVFIVPDKGYTKNKSTKDIPVLKIGEDIEFEYSLNSHIFTPIGPFIFSPSPLNSSDQISQDLIKIMKKTAKKLGADAIIGLTRSSYFGVFRSSHFASGLAVNYADANIKEPEEGIITCLLPIASSNSGEEAVEYDFEIRTLARHTLIFKGYYVLTPVTDFTVNETSIDSILENYDVEQVCGIKPDILIKFFPNVDDTKSSKLLADAYSLKSGKYIMGSSEAVDDRNRILATATMGLSGLIISSIGSGEVSMGRLLKPLPNIR